MLTFAGKVLCVLNVPQELLQFTQAPFYRYTGLQWPGHRAKRDMNTGGLVQSFPSHCAILSHPKYSKGVLEGWKGGGASVFLLWGVLLVPMSSGGPELQPVQTARIHSLTTLDSTGERSPF